MINSKKLVLSPEIAFQEEKLREYLIANKYIFNTDEFKVRKRSIDARQKKVKVNLSIDIHTSGSLNELVDSFSSINSYDRVDDCPPVLIIGAGPAGLFAALECLELGVKPIVLER